MNILDKVKSKIGKYFKIVVPFLKVFFGSGRSFNNTNYIIRTARKRKKKNFYDAQVYDLPTLFSRIKTATDKELASDDLRELLETLPICLNNIAITKEKWYIAKIKNESNPFDIWMAPERLVTIKDKKVNIYRGCNIQTKRLLINPPKSLSLKEWLAHLECIFKEKISNMDLGFNGQIHFYNCIHIKESVDIKTLEALFRKLYIPYNKNVDCISLSIPLDNPTGNTTVMTYFIYPMVMLAGVLDLDIKTAQEIYMDDFAKQIMIDVLKSKMFKYN